MKNNYFEEVATWINENRTLDFNLAILSNGDFKGFKCPFCGKNESVFISNTKKIKCNNKACDASGPIGKDKEDAIKKWSK